MRFLDASVFLYAYLLPKKTIPADIELAKKKARAIIKRVNDGEKAVTSLVHISEVANILGAMATLEKTLDIISGLLDLSNLEILEGTKIQYVSAVEDARAFSVGVNDALASILMKSKGISEVYSFDRDFDKLKHLKRVTE